MAQAMKIMVVDDEPFIREMMEEFLSVYGYDVILVGSGEDAVSKMNIVKPDMILLDIWMPGMSGLDTLDKLKEINSDVGIVMLSAFGDDNTVEEAIEMGANHFLQKPIEFKKLLNILELWQTSGTRAAS